MATDNENFNTVLEYACKIIKSESATMPTGLTIIELTNLIAITHAWSPDAPMSVELITLFRTTVKTVFSLSDDDELITDDEKLEDYVSRAAHSGAAIIGLANKFNDEDISWLDWDIIRQ